MKDQNLALEPLNLESWACRSAMIASAFPYSRIVTGLFQ